MVARVENGMASTSMHVQSAGVKDVHGYYRMTLGEAPGGFEPPIRVLQTPALPLGYGAGEDLRNYGTEISGNRHKLSLLQGILACNREIVPCAGPFKPTSLTA